MEKLLWIYVAHDASFKMTLRLSSEDAGIHGIRWASVLLCLSLLYTDCCWWCWCRRTKEKKQWPGDELTTTRRAYDGGDQFGKDTGKRICSKEKERLTGEGRKKKKEEKVSGRKIFQMAPIVSYFFEQNTILVLKVFFTFWLNNNNNNNTNFYQPHINIISLQ